MITLAVDSAGKAAGVAILKESQLLYENYLDNGLTHSQTLLPMLKSALAACSLQVADVGLMGVAAGPGSFTGLRIGMALVKGLALPQNILCAGVSTLEAMARSVYLPQGSVVICALDARRGEVYAAAFQVEGDLVRRLMPDKTGLPQQLLAPVMARCKNPVFVIGDGAEVCYNELKKIGPLTLLPERWRKGRAAGVAYAALDAWQQGKAVQAGQLTVAYHRLSQAEREREKKLKETNGL